MILNNVQTIANLKTPLSFKGDKTVLYSYYIWGLKDKDRLLSDDVYIKRDAINEDIFIEKILRKSHSTLPLKQNWDKYSFNKNCFLITGNPAVGKSTFMLKVAKLLENRGVQTILYKHLDNHYNPAHSKSLDDIINYLKTSDNTKIIVIFMDEFHSSYDDYIDLVLLSKNLSNIRIVCTAPTVTYQGNDSSNSWDTACIPNENVVVLKSNKVLMLKFINSGLKAAGFQKIPKRFENKILNIIDSKGDYRWIFKNLYYLIFTEMHSNNDINTIENIPDKIWQKVCDDIMPK